MSLELDWKTIIESRLQTREVPLRIDMLIQKLLTLWLEKTMWLMMVILVLELSLSCKEPESSALVNQTTKAVSDL